MGRRPAPSFFSSASSGVTRLFLGWCPSLLTSSNSPRGPSAVGAFLVLHLFCAGVFLTHLPLLFHTTASLLRGLVAGHCLILTSGWLYWRLVNSDPGYFVPPTETALATTTTTTEDEDVVWLLEAGSRVMSNVPGHTCHACGGVAQPLRTKHCKDCKRCVRKFDHHCFWIGQPFFFFLFLVIQRQLCLHQRELCWRREPQALCDVPAGRAASPDLWSFDGLGNPDCSNLWRCSAHPFPFSLLCLQFPQGLVSYKELPSWLLHNAFILIGKSFFIAFSFSIFCLSCRLSFPCAQPS